MTNPIPEGFTAVTPHLTCKDAGAAIEFYKKAFGAEEILRMPGPDGNGVMHAEISICGSRIMLGDEFPDMSVSPTTLGNSPVTVHLYVNDCDGVYNQAVSAGATAVMPPMDAFWGDRYGKLVDPFGHHWSVATHVNDPTPEEMQAGMAAMMGG